MDPMYLSRDELEYELAVRGILEVGAETLRSMRRLLKDKQKNEGFGKIVCHESFNPNVEDEIGVCSQKVDDLEAFVGTFQEGADSEEAKYIFSLLHHLFGRLRRLQVDDDAEGDAAWKTRLENLLSKLEEIESNVDKKCFSFMSALSQKQNSLQLGNHQGQHVAEVTAPTTDPNTRSTVVVQPHRIPVSQWGITFDGRKTGLSVSAFLEKIETYRVARNASEDDLKNSLIDLLKGDALIWYTSIRSQVDSWQTFVRLFKEEYLPYDHNEKLWELIRARNQNQNESIGTYFACMINLFNRLETPASEDEKLYILKRNILPYYIHQLGSQGNITTVDELRKLCKNWEVNRQVATRPRASLHTSISSIEPDLAGDPGSSQSNNRGRSEHAVGSVDTVSNRKCWNCNEQGHCFQQCRKSRDRKFCFRCGKPGVTRYSCSNCSKNVVLSRR